MKKILFILLVALCVSCTKTSDDVSPRLLGAFNYSESLKGTDGTVYKNAICQKGTGYVWAVEETPKGESRNWRTFEYKSISDMQNDFGKLVTVSCYKDDDILRFGFNWEGAEGVTKVVHKKVGKDIILIMGEKEDKICFPDAFVKNAKAYIDDYLY